MTLIDTDILIDINRGRVEISENLDRLKATEPLGISIVTKMELIVGCRNKQELGSVLNLIDRLDVVPVSEQASELATELLAKYRLSHALLIPDALIAASALQHGHRLLTRNRKHFGFVPGLQLLALAAPAT